MEAEGDDGSDGSWQDELLEAQEASAAELDGGAAVTELPLWLSNPLLLCVWCVRTRRHDQKKML